MLLLQRFVCVVDDQTAGRNGRLAERDIMLNLPAPPRTRIIRQLECACCHHIFSISEDDAVSENGNHEPGNNWQLSPDHYPDTRLRYQPERSRRPITPEPRAAPRANDNYAHEKDEEHINCPRCGADNRNWLHILNPPVHIHAERFRTWLENRNIAPGTWQIALTILLASFAGALAYLIFNKAAMERWGLVLSAIAILAVSFLALLLVFIVRPQTIIRLWYSWQKFGAAPFGLLLTAVLIILAAHFHYDPGNVRRSITLLVATALAGIVPTFAMLGTWASLREYKFFRAVVPAQSRLDFSPPLRVWLGYTALFLFIIPFLLYFLIPGAFHFAFTLIDPEEEPVAPPPVTLEQRIRTARTELEPIFDNEPEVVTEPVGDAIDELLNLFEAPPLSTETLDELTEKEKADLVLIWTTDLIKNAPRKTTGSVANTVTQLEKIINITKLPEGAQIDEPEPATRPKAQDWLTIDDVFLSTWFRYVLASSIAALVFSLVAVNGYVRRINRALPHPLFHSIAAMTRVVAWEAGAALEIGREIDNIQWTNIRRNAAGGIDLEGIYRDVPPPGEADKSVQARVRAQRYEISTDRWGRIQSAQITAVRVPVQPRLPKQHEKASIGSEFFRSAVRAHD